MTLWTLRLPTSLPDLACGAYLLLFPLKCGCLAGVAALARQDRAWASDEDSESGSDEDEYSA